MLKGPSVIIMQPSLFPKKFRDTHSLLQCTTFTWTTNSNTRKGRNISPHGKSIFSTQNQKHISSQVKRKNKIQRHEKRIQRQKNLPRHYKTQTLLRVLVLSSKEQWRPILLNRSWPGLLTHLRCVPNQHPSTKNRCHKLKGICRMQEYRKLIEKNNIKHIK